MSGHGSRKNTTGKYVKNVLKGVLPATGISKPSTSTGTFNPQDVAAALSGPGASYQDVQKLSKGLEKNVQLRQLQKEAADIVGGPLEEFGRAPGPGRSLRLNPDLQFLPGGNVDTSDITEEDLAAIETLVDTTATTKNIEPEEPGMDMSGGKRRQRGGAMTRAEKLQYAKAVAMMVLYNSGRLIKEGGAYVAPRGKAYFISRFITPLYGTTSRTAQIMAGLADQIIQSGVTVTNLSVSAFGYTANVASKIIQKFNAWGTATSAKLLSDDYAQSAADAAVESSTQIATTAGVGLFVANQIGILPMSALLAAILFTLKVNIGTGPGRAYVAASFYTWFVAQSPGDKKKIVKHAQDYATTAGKGASAAAGKLGPLLAKGAAGAASMGAGAAQNAFAVVAAAIQNKGDGTPAAVPSSAPAVTAALTAGEASAAESVVIAAERTAGTGGTSTPSGGRKKKTAKRALKKARTTRRRKAPKYLAAPVVGRKGVFAY